MKAVRVTPSNSVAVQMASPFHKVHLTMDAIAHNQNSNVARMKLLLPKDQTSKVVHALPVNMVAVRMDKRKQKVAISMVVKIFQRHRKSRAVFQKTAAPVAISPLKTSSTSNMEHAPDSGTVDAAAMITDLKQLKIAKVHASRPKEKVLVYCRKYMARVPDIIRRSTMILIEIFVHNSFMAVVWVTTIVSRQRKRARNFASLIKLCVSVF